MSLQLASSLLRCFFVLKKTHCAHLFGLRFFILSSLSFFLPVGGVEGGG